MKKTATWKVCVFRSERLDPRHYQLQGWKSFVYVSITKNPFEEHQILIAKTIVLIWEWKAHFIELDNLIHDFWSEKNIIRCVFLHLGACMHQKCLNEAWRKCGLVVFIDEHGYILQKEAGVSKHSWKKIMELLCAVLKNVKHGFEHDIDST